MICFGREVKELHCGQRHMLIKALSRLQTKVYKETIHLYSRPRHLESYYSIKQHLEIGNNLRQKAT